MTDITDDQLDLALKAKHRTMWALGDYAAVADQVIPDLGAVLVQAAGVRAGQRVLDVAAGSGNAAIPAALAGAAVVASDLTPELLEAGRQAAAKRGASLDWQEADAEALPFDSESFDVVMSCVGVMFAPHHQAAADELVRVCRPDGMVAILSWTPEGFVGQMLAAMKPYVPPSPAGAQPPPLWGSEAHIQTLFGDRVDDLSFQRESVRVSCFGQPSEFREFFKNSYGPTVNAYRGLAENPDRVAMLDRDLDELAREHAAPDGAMDWEYLIVTCRRR